MLADLPGYGYAKASKIEIRRWTQLIFDYLRGRPSLRRVCLLLDARHGLKDKDIDVMKDLDKAAVSYQIILTKCDKAKPDELTNLADTTASKIARHVAAHPTILQTSSVKNEGLDVLRTELAMMADIR